MGYFGKKVGSPIERIQSAKPSPPTSSPADVQGKLADKAHFAAQVGKATVMPPGDSEERCPRCQGALRQEDGWMRCSGRCGRSWVIFEPKRLIDPATLPFGACSCCRPRVPLVAAEVGAICPESHVEYLIVPEGIQRREEVAPLGVCRCCLPPQPLVKNGNGLVCRNKPEQHYQVVKGKGGDAEGQCDGKVEVEWIGVAPALDQAHVTAAIDQALSANNAELTIFGLFAPPVVGRGGG